MTKGQQIVAQALGKNKLDGYPKLTENHPFFGKLKAFMVEKHYWMGTATDHYLSCQNTLQRELDLNRL